MSIPNLERRRELRARAGGVLTRPIQPRIARPVIVREQSRSLPSDHMPIYPIPKRDGGRTVTWSYGVTTISARAQDTLPRTLTSLAKAGFDRPRLFVDGPHDPAFAVFGLEVTYRGACVKTAAHWSLSAAELYFMNPHADLYAIFQDDFVCCRRLREYIESIEYPADGYCNLYVFPENQRLCDQRHQYGWVSSNQCGLGAVALIFDRDALEKLLSHPYMVQRVQDRQRGWHKVDGGIVETMKKCGKREYVHCPALIQHTGRISSMGNNVHALARFVGEDFDAMDLLK